MSIGSEPVPVRVGAAVSSVRQRALDDGDHLVAGRVAALHDVVAGEKAGELRGLLVGAGSKKRPFNSFRHVLLT